MSRMYENYKKTVVPALIKEFGYKNTLQVPKCVKVVLNIGVKEALQDEKILSTITATVSAISGQKPVITKAKKSIAGFKLRAGDPIGISITLRGKKMYDFLDKLFSIVLPRVRDFKGLKTSSFDEKGNYSLGLREMTVFPEVDYNKLDKAHGLGISVVTNAKSREEGKKLLELLGLPFSKESGGKN